MPNLILDPKKFSALLASAREQSVAAKVPSQTSILDALRAKIAAEKPEAIELPIPLAVPVALQPTNLDDPIPAQVEEDCIEFLSTICLPSVQIPEPIPFRGYGVEREVTLNTKQQEASDLVLSGEDCIIVGAAGTGKTTLMRKTTRRLIDEEKIGYLTEETKTLSAGKPGAAIVSFTRKAVNNIRHAVVEELKGNTLTLHKLLEFQPEFYYITDPASGLERKTMRFIPNRNAFNPLPRSLQRIVFEEASMIAVSLYELLQDAMPHKHQEVFIGDIQQLPPTFGMAILGFKMLELPIIELTEVYRQALESPILSLAWKILEGDPNVFSGKLEEYTPDGSTTKRKRAPALETLSQTKYAENGDLLGITKFQIWQKQLDDTNGVLTAGAQFIHWAKTAYYNPEEDIILCPYNKAFGTIELNNKIAQYLGVKRDATVHEVIAGYNKHYLAVGDRVLYDKEDAFIVNIAINSEYTGKRASPASKQLDRWGTYQAELSDAEEVDHAELIEKQEADVDIFMAMAASEVEDRVNAASHGITIRYSHSDEEQVLESAAEINNLLGGYALTVHKFQGSEADRVFLVLHNSHAKMVSRELLYTAVTRAKKFLHIICEPKSFFNGISSQRIKGNTLAEKAMTFTGAKNEMDAKRQAEELEEHRKRVASYERASESMNKEQDTELATQFHTPVKSLSTLAELTAATPKIESGTAKYNFQTGKMEY